ANQNRTWKFNQTIDLTNATDAMVSFYAKWDIEADYDYCQFQVSTNGGSSWIGQCGSYTVEGSSTPWNGSAQPDGEPVWEGSSDWVLEEISLSDYLGQQIQVRFQFESDGGVQQDGFYFDDFKMSFNENSAGLVEEQKNSFKIFPNPASENITIAFQSLVEAGSTVMLYNNAGQLLSSSEMTSTSNLFEASVAGLNAGFYTVVVERLNGE